MGVWDIGFYYYNREIKDYELVLLLYEIFVIGDVVVNFDSEILF